MRWTLITTSDLREFDSIMGKAENHIKELMDEARIASVAALVISFADRFELVFSTDAGALKVLNTLVEEGGKPLAISGIRPTGDKQMGFFARPLEEHQQDISVYRYLDREADQIRDRLIKRGR